MPSLAVADDTIPHLSYKNAGALKELAKFYRQTGPGTLVQVRMIQFRTSTVTCSTVAYV